MATLALPDERPVGPTGPAARTGMSPWQRWGLILLAPYALIFVIFEGAKNKRRAKEFVTFLMQDENLQPYVEGSLGRWFPVTTSGTKSAFWQADPHRKAVFNQFGAGTVTFEFTKNYKFTVLNNENVWAKAMSRVVNDNVAVEKAVDEMIARIKQVAG